MMLVPTASRNKRFAAAWMVKRHHHHNHGSLITGNHYKPQASEQKIRDYTSFGRQWDWPSSPFRTTTTSTSTLAFSSNKPSPPSNNNNDNGDNDSDNQDIISLQQSASTAAASSSSSSSIPSTTTTREDEFLRHQQTVFDKISTWFGDREKEVTPELVPVYQAMTRDILSSHYYDNNNNNNNKNDDKSSSSTLKILDVACGTGVLWDFLVSSSMKEEEGDGSKANDDDTATSTARNLEITGVDLSPAMVDLAREKAKILLQEQQENENSGKHSNSSNNFRHNINSISVVQSDVVSFCQNYKNNENGNDDGDTEATTTSSTFGFDLILVNACFGNFLDSRQVLQALCDVAVSSAATTTTICISHPLGASFVKKLHNESPETVPHVLPESLLEATKLIHGLPCVTTSLKCDDDDDGYYLWTIRPCRAKGLPNNNNNVLRFRGVVDQGYGRGGKKLGVPTANLPASLFQNALEDISTGVYFGWAALEREDNDDDDDPLTIYKSVVNVGYSPTFEGKENSEKIIEAHLILNGDDEEGLPDFYGVPMRLQLIGFLRDEKKFDSFPDLIAQIHADIQDAKDSLDDIPYQQMKDDDFLSGVSPLWIGSSGGDESASWEFAPMIDAVATVLRT